MLEICMSGSVGVPGGQPPGTTRRWHPNRSPCGNAETRGRCRRNCATSKLGVGL